MDVKRVTAVAPQPMDLAGAEGVTMRVVFSDATGAPTFAMRQFEVRPGGHTPFHRHPYEHEVYIMEGEGTLREGPQGTRPLKAGDAVYVAPDEFHQFQNTGTAPLKFLCMIPLKAGGSPHPLPSCEG